MSALRGHLNTPLLFDFSFVGPSFVCWGFLVSNSESQDCLQLRLQKGL